MEPNLSDATAADLAFDAPRLADALASLSDAELDALPYGVVEMDRDAIVRRYNRQESERSGLPPDRVLQRHFFREVAPCTDNPLVAGRFVMAGLDVTIPYVFALRMRPRPVTLRLMHASQSARQYVCVRWNA